MPKYILGWPQVALVRLRLTKFSPFSSDSVLLESEEPSRTYYNIARGWMGRNISRPSYTSSATHNFDFFELLISDEIESFFVLFLKPEKCFILALCFDIIFIWEIVHQNRLFNVIKLGTCSIYISILFILSKQTACIAKICCFVTIMKMALKIKHRLPIFHRGSFIVNSCSRVLAINFQTFGNTSKKTSMKSWPTMTQCIILSN